MNINLTDKSNNLQKSIRLKNILYIDFSGCISNKNIEDLIIDMNKKLGIDNYKTQMNS